MICVLISIVEDVIIATLNPLLLS